ncbi:hypothetical protein D3C85_1438360 [compost metagenome]
MNDGMFSAILHRQADPVTYCREVSRVRECMPEPSGQFTPGFSRLRHYPVFASEITGNSAGNTSIGLQFLYLMLLAPLSEPAFVPSVLFNGHCRLVPPEY